MMTQRELDILRLEVEEYFAQIVEEFRAYVMGDRINYLEEQEDASETEPQVQQPLY